jgi:flagellar biosynthesis/type III secretory pathway M-ring protein FliF/YscJ
MNFIKVKKIVRDMSVCSKKKGDYKVQFTDPPYLYEDKAIVRQKIYVDVKDNGWIMIMVYVIIGIVALILFIIVVRFCIKNRNSNSGAIHQALI